MEARALCNGETGISSLKNIITASAAGPSLLYRRIEFVPARKQSTSFASNVGGFQIETLKPVQSLLGLHGLDNHESVNKIEPSGFLKNGLDLDIGFEITFRRIGAGLENLGNTCFLNSVLQCLTYTEPLAAYLQSGKHQNSCHVAGFCALCAIQKHVRCALQSTGRSLVPKDLVSNLRCISRNFRNARQEDAHEYMVNLLESMHKCCLPVGMPSESPAAYEKSLVHKIFGGRLRSQVECQNCSYCSNKFDPFLDLSLDIVKADALRTALHHFIASELLDGGEKHYLCQQCKQRVRAKKRLTVHEAPYVLTIHLKRFHAHDPGRKVNKQVLFERSLDLKPFISGVYEGENMNYSLYGVLVHFGESTHSGHYVCFVRTSSGMWYLLNDNEVRQVGEKTVLDQKAYMLFYVRDRGPTISKSPTVALAGRSGKATESGMAGTIRPRSTIFSNFVSYGSPPSSPRVSASKVDGLGVGQSKNSILSVTCHSKAQELDLLPTTCGIKIDHSDKQKGSCNEMEDDDVGKHVSNEKEEDEDGIQRNSEESSSPSSIEKQLSHEKSLNYKATGKKKRKHQITKLLVGSAFFRESLGSRKAKKRRNRRHLSGRTEDMICNLPLSGETPSCSTLKKSVETEQSCSLSRDRGAESCSRKNQTGGSDMELRGSSIINGTQVSFQAKAHRSDVLGMMNSTVAKWDDMELPSSIAVESKTTELRIGYVLDDWDEHYDLGRRKKIRYTIQRSAIGNPFQKLAADKMAKHKSKTKIEDKDMPSNQPFRI